MQKLWTLLLLFTIVCTFLCACDSKEVPQSKMSVEVSKVSAEASKEVVRESVKPRQLIERYTMEETNAGWFHATTGEGGISGPTDPDPKRLTLSHYCDEDTSEVCLKEEARLVDKYIAFANCEYLNKNAREKKPCDMDMADVEQALKTIKFKAPPRLPKNVLIDSAQVVVDGPLVRDSVLKSIRTRVSMLRYAARKNQSDKPYLGMLKFEMQINPDGHVDEVKILESASNNPDLYSALQKEVAKWRFQQSTGTTKVKFTVEIKE